MVVFPPRFSRASKFAFVPFWALAYRFGEALHPGPGSRLIRVATCNPTSVHCKERDLLQLGAEVLCLSETSAVASVQRIVTKTLRAHGYHAFFGQPVPPHAGEAAEGFSLRGAAGGVAVITSLPCRRSPEPLPLPMVMTTRITECFVRFGSLEIRLLTVYGLPSTHVDSRHANDALLRTALQRLAGNTIPTLVAGDFNTDVTALPVWESYQALGFVEAHSYVEHRLGITLPATCKGATHFDSMLLPPVLQARLRSAEVCTDHAFDAHDPLVLTFESPENLPTLRRWTAPRPWTDFQVDEGVFEQAYHQLSAPVDQCIHDLSSEPTLDGVSQAFTMWASHLEAAVDCTLARTHRDSPGEQPQPHLPRAYKGRCKPLRHVSRPVAQLPRAARHGDYEPPIECTSIRLRMKVRQVRRARALLGGIRKAERLSCPPDSMIQQLLQEWQALQRAKGYGLPFLQWVSSWDFVGYVPIDWPSSTWLHDLVQLLEFDCQAEAAREAKLRRQAYLLRVLHDEQDQHSKLGFAMLRGDIRPPLTTVQDTVSARATLCHQDAYHEASFQVASDVPLPLPFHIGHPVKFGDLSGLISAVDGPVVAVAFDAQVQQCQGTLSQIQHRCTAEELHSGFSTFWSHFWDRDTPAEARSLDSWPSFQQLLARMPPAWAQLPIDVQSLSVWKKALRRASVHRATGPCGFSVAELKQLPDLALRQLADLFMVSYSTGLPRYLLFGRVRVLAKVDFPTSFTHGRPITVLSTLVRLWGSLLSTQLLRAWSAFLPASVVGGVPQRSACDLTYAIQHQLEASKLQGDCLSGFTLDMIKFFNTLPRPPMQALLSYMGCPPQLAAFWVDLLFSIRRFTVFHGDAGPPALSTTGCPEGDAMSVAAAVAVSYLYAHLMQDFSLRPAVFIDNWSWSSDDPQLHAVGMAETQSIARALSLQIDWAKSFAWSVSNAGLAWWKEFGGALMPPGASLTILPDARDLGAAMRFRHMQLLGFLRDRLDQGMLRLQRLALQPRPIKNKAMMIQSAIWPACFHASEAHAIGAAHIRRLRGTAARVLVGSYRALSPYLAMCVLAPQVQDPEAFLLTQALRSLRRQFLVNPELANSILRTAVDAPGSPCSAIGPATSLKVMLRRNGWTLHATGVCTGPGNVRISLMTASARDISQAVNVAWAYSVREAAAHRNGLAGAGIPCPHLTSQVLSKFALPQQKLLARHITGAFQSGMVRSAWSAHDCDACPWCEQPDTKLHRFTACPAFATVRERHPFAMQILLDQRPEWVHGPYATLAPAQDIANLLFATRPPPSWPPPVSLQGLPTPLTFFTDGGCRNPQVPAARLAAWSVVLDTTPPGGHDRAMDLWAQHGLHPPALQVQSLGAVPGKQTAPRAELCAALQATRIAAASGRVPCTIVTDCAYVVRVFREFSSGFGVKGFLRAANQDLLQLLQEVWFPQVEVRKVKAHELDKLDRASAGLWDHLGNHAADTSCTMALDNELPFVQEMAADILEFQEQQADMLHAVFSYLVDLDATVQRLQPGPSSQAAEQRDEAPLEAIFPTAVHHRWQDLRRRWWVGSPLAPPSQQVHAGCKWGPEFSWRVWHWSQTLSWTAADRSPFTGTTTLELLCNFVCVTGSLPPVAIRQESGSWFCQAADTVEAHLIPAAIRYWLHVLTCALKYLEKRTHMILLPGLRRRKICTLQPWGDRHPRSGTAARVTFLKVEETSALIHRVLSRNATQELLRYSGQVNVQSRRWHMSP